MYWSYKNFVIHQFSELESTNKTAFELASNHTLSDREIILAKKQSAGRGRMSRNWSSPEGNLYFSILLKPQKNLSELNQLSFVGIVALHLAVRNSTMKWPNDLLINQKKVAGLLLESKINQKNCDFVVVGIGVNIASNPSQTIFPASNLHECGIEITPEDLLKKFLDEFENLYQNWLDFGFAKTRRIWMQNAHKLNEEIKCGDDFGVFLGIDEDGNLLLKKDERISKISVADVS